MNQTIKKRITGIFSILLLLIIFGVSLFIIYASDTESAYISLNKKQLFLEEILEVSLTFPTLDNITVDLFTPTSVYRYPYPSSTFRYKVNDIGTYRINVYNNRVLVASETFYVIEDPIIDNDTGGFDELGKEDIIDFFSLSKPSYNLGEEVIIIFNENHFSKSFKLSINSENQNLNYMNDLTNPTKFIPRKRGEYEVLVYDEGALLENETFYVLDITKPNNQTSQEEPLVLNNTNNISANNDKEIKNISAETNQLNEYTDSTVFNLFSPEGINFQIKNSKGYYLYTNLILNSVETGIKNLKLTTLSYLNLSKGKYNVEVYPELAGIKTITFKELNYQGEFELGLEELSGVKVGKQVPKKAYAIDPSKLEFSTGSLEVEAKGDILFKCKEWNFTEQKCYGEWELIRTITPGEIYALEINSADPAYAEVGLASINTEKSLYYPGETAKLTIVALDNEGYLVSNAYVALEIKDPLGNSTFLTTLEGNITEMERGIYEAYYNINEIEGNYTLFVSVIGNNVNNTMYSYFSVLDYYEFDILRNTPVTTDPWQSPFITQINILDLIDNKSYYNFTEILPSSFTITNGSYSEIIQQENYTLLKWYNLSNRSYIEYTAQPPLITPELYTLRSFIEYNGSVFTEARPWYLAVDPIIYSQVCAGQDNANGQDTYSATGCDGSYPGACGAGGDLLSCDDDQSEIHTASNNDRWAGVRINSYNSSMNDCLSITKVELCYEWWRTVGYDVARIAVDRDDWASPTTISSTVPGTTANPGVTCIEITSSEAWTCSNFDGTGTAAQAVAQLQRDGTSTSPPTARTVYIDLLYFNLTYQGDNSPNVTLNTPAAYYYNNTNNPANITFNCSIKDDIRSQNISLYITNSANTSFSYNQSCDITTQNGSCVWSLLLSNGEYRWNCLGYDNRSQSDWGDANRSIVVAAAGVDDFPTVSLTSPVDYFNSTSTTVQLTCLAEDTTDLYNISLYTNITGSFDLTDYITLDGGPNTSYLSVFTLSSIPNGTTFIWNCLVYDNSTLGQFAWASANRTVSIKENPIPLVYLFSPEDETTQTETTINFNCSATDDEDISSLALYSNRTGSFGLEQVVTFTGNSDTNVNYIFTQSGFSDTKGYVWNCKAIDNESNEVFYYTNYSFNVVLGAPNVTLNTPADESYDLDGNVALDCSAVDDQDIVSISLYHDLSGTMALNQTVYFPGTSDTSATVLFNLTGLSYGTRFKWTCSAEDNSSLVSYAAENRSLKIVNLYNLFAEKGEGTWTSPSNAAGKPDEVTANELLNTEYILRVYNFSGVPTQGTLLETYFSLSWYTASTGGNDLLRLSYSTTNSTYYNLTGIIYDKDTAKYANKVSSLTNQSYQITGTLTTADLSSLYLRVEGDQVTSPDYNTAYIDSIFLSIMFDYLPSPYAITKTPSAVYQNTYVDFYSNWTDDFYLGCYIFSINQTGVWQNSSCIPFLPGAWDERANYSMQITALPGTNVQWRFYANDSRSQWNSTTIQSFVVVDPNDIIKPTISNEQVQPLTNSSGSIFNISAIITDNYQVDRAYVELTNPNGQTTNYSMSSNGDLYYYYYQGWIGGNYSFRIIAFDSVNNSNYSSTYPIFNVTPVITTNYIYYERGDIVPIIGKGYSSLNNVTLNIFRANGTLMSGYPINISSNLTGGFLTSWLIPSSLAEKLDNYTIEGNDTYRNYLKNSTEIVVVVKSDDSNKYDNNYPTGTSVLTQLNQSDDITTTIVSRGTVAYIDLIYQDLILYGYTLDDLILYVEHEDYDTTSDPLVVQYYDGTTYQTATCGNIPFSSTNLLGACNLTPDLAAIPDKNDIRIRLTDNNAGVSGSDFSKIDIAYLDIEFSISNTLSVDILEPTNELTLVDYTDSVYNKAYGGSTADIVTNTQMMGTESSDYTKLESSDNTRWQSTATTSGHHVYQSFYMYTNIPESDITSIDVTWEGYMTKNGVNAEDIRIFAWDYTAGEYVDLNGEVAITGSTVDQTLAFTLPGIVDDYINSTGYLNILVQSATDLQGAPQVRLDSFTDYIKLDIYSIKTISGYQDINISAVDGDGVQSCTINFINSSNFKYNDIYTNKLSDFFFYNLTDTSDYSDGIYNLTANCTDGTEIKYDSVLVRIYNVAPLVELMYPYEGLNFTINNINFTWNASQETGNPTCNLYIDNKLNVSGIVSTNKQNTTQIVYNLPDGNHNWSVSCTNLAGVVGYSEMRNFTVDTLAPVITLNYPIESQNISTPNITFNYTPIDTNILNCSIYINGIYNNSNTSVIPNRQTSFYVTNLLAGKYNWTVYCTDRYSQTGQSTVNNFTIDLDNPRIILTLPIPGQLFLGGLVQFNYTAYDDIDLYLSCNIMVNNFNEFTGLSSPNATPVVQSKEINSGLKYWNVTCTDDSGRQNTSETWNFTVSGPPTVTPIYPANMTSLNEENITFIYFADDTDGIKNCSLYLNNQWNQTNVTIYTGEYNNFTINTMAETYYNWSMQCYDNLSVSTTSGLYKFTLDRTPPIVYMYAPYEGSFYEDGDLTFNFSVIDNLDSSLTCTIFIDDIARTASNTDFAAQNGTIQTRIEIDIPGGDHYWYAACTDDSGLSYYADAVNFQIGGLPTVTPISPGDNTYHIGNVSFVYFAYDSDNIQECSLYINGEYNRTNTTIFNNDYNNFSLYNLEEQYLNWSVNCTDTLGLSTMSLVYWLTIDNTPPIVTLVSPNGTSSTSTTQIFNFSIIENTMSSLTCDIFVNGTNVDPGFTATNGSNTRTVPGLNYGTSFWNVTCTDGALLLGVSQTYNFTITETPIITLLNPPDDSVDIDGNVIFRFQVDNNNILNCSLYLNGQLNNSIYPPDIIPYGESIIQVNGLQEQLLNWTVGCINDDYIEANATNGPWRLHVDWNSPNVSLNNPVNSANISLSTITFNFTAFDNVDDVLLCNLTINGTINQTNISSQNGQPTTTTVTGFGPGIYFWNVTCTDGYFANTSETYYFNVSAIPTIELVSPEPDYKDRDGDIIFTYIPSTIDELGFLQCRLYIDDLLYNLNSSLTAEDNGIELSFTNTSIPEGDHTWKINCTDFGGYTGNSEYRNFTVDLVDPTVYLTYPNNIILNSSFNFNFTAIDNVALNLVCLLTNNNTEYTGITAINNTPYLYPISGLTDGLFYWNVTCNDTAGRTNTSLTYNYTVAEKPTVSLISPINHNRTTQTDFNFTYIPNDNSGVLQNCSLIINGNQNTTNYTIYPNNQNNFSASNFIDGEYNWTIECYDPSGNKGNYTPAYQLIVDLMGPNISMIFPTEGGTYNFEDINFTWVATDTWATNLMCNITLDGKLNTTNITTLSGQITNYTIYNLPQGEHNWTLDCWDDLNNPSTSDTINFTVNAPDLTLNASHIIFNNTNPDENETITINATIYNIGGATAYNVPVEFWDGIPEEGGSRINGIQTISSLIASASTTVNVSWNISLGMHNIYVIINYTGVELNKSNNNATVNVSVLHALINSPLNETWTNETQIEFNFTMWDYTDNLINYSIIVDGIPNGQTGNSTSSISKLLNVTLIEGMHYVSVRATDYLSRIKDSPAILLYIDQTPPKGRFETPDEWWFNDASPEIFFNITDNLAQILNYSLYVNESLENSSTIINGTSKSINLTDKINSTYILTLNSTDLALNKNSTSIRIYIDTVEPTIELLYPVDFDFFTTNTTQLNFSVNDNLDPYIGCNITLDNQVNLSYINASRQQTINTTIYNLNEGTHYWNVTCWDGGLSSNINNINTSETRSFNVYIPPIITLISPENNNWTNIENVTFFYTVSDTTGIENCSLILNNEIITTNTTIFNNALNNFTVFDMYGIYNWSIQCYDNTSMRMYARTENRTLYVDTIAPEPYIETLDNTWFNVPNPTIYYNITDNLDLQINYTFYANGTANVNGTVQNSTSSSRQLFGLGNGTYILVLEALDDAYNRRNSTSISINIDTVAPTITLISPEQANSTIDTNIFFNFTANDNLASSLICNLTIDNINRETFNVTPNNYNTTTLSMTAGTHYWNVTCVDFAGNVNTSETRYFIIPLPDLKITALDINFNNSIPEERTNITINATIYNIGETNAYNVTIQFFDGHYSNGTQINGNLTYNISSGSNITVNLSWYVNSTGNHYIYVVVDPPIETNGSILESNESNNYAYKFIMIGSYNVVYGNLSGFLNLKDITNRTLYQWDISEYNGSRIYAIDYDSNVEWQELQAISMDINDAYISNDFSEIDIALKMENNTDSINSTWTLNNNPVVTKDYIIFKEKIQNVPLTNSTNTSNFMTGILWDKSDGNNQYNGSQDLVFFTTVNVNQTGIYGNYDYELKIPSNLRFYKGSNTITVALYTELN